MKVLTVEEMKKVAQKKVYEAYLDGARAERKGNYLGDLDAKEYKHQAFIMAQGYMAVGLMEEGESTTLELQAEDQAIKEWTAKRDAHQLTEEEAKKLRKWMRDEEERFTQEENDHDEKSEHMEAYFASGNGMAFALVKYGIRPGMSVGKIIDSVIHEIEVAEKEQEEVANAFKKNMKAGKVEGYKSIITKLMDFEYSD